jgi:uncharacterized protein (TIGR02646 family)
MIALERPSGPKQLTSRVATETLQEAAAFFAADTRGSRQRTFAFDAAGLLEHSEVVAALHKLTNGHCAFCGIGEGVPAELGPHRLRPAQDAVDAAGGTSRRHYWWLAFEWSNLYLACGNCRLAQGAKFPTRDERVRAGTTDQLAQRERPYLLDPCEDDPEALFVYLDSGEMVAQESRGIATIEIFDLNRPRLVDERRQQVEWARAQIAGAAKLLAAGRFAAFADEFLDLYSRSAPFAALRRQLFNQWVQFRPRKVQAALDQAEEPAPSVTEAASGLRRVTHQLKRDAERAFRRAVAGAPPPADLGMLRVEERIGAALDLKTGTQPEARTGYLSTPEIRSVQISNFQAIESLRLNLAEGAGEGAWLMLLGENGAGKTAVLKAIALTLADRETLDKLEIRPQALLRQGSKAGSVRVELTGSDHWCEMHMTRSELRFEGSAPGVMLAGYGATRLLTDESSQEDQPLETPIGSLFDPRRRLVQPRALLTKLSTDDFDAVATALRGLLQLGEEQEIRRDRRTGLKIVDPDGSRFTLDELSDGYRTMAALCLDMMAVFLRRWGSIAAAEGTVLIDELGAHLHPRWQMQVTRSLREAFRRVQFVATTHDPLCLRGLHDGEVVVLRRSPDDGVVASQDGLPTIEGLEVDQLLTSEHFGLDSTLDPRVADVYDRYYELLSRPRDDEEAAGELPELKDRLAALRQLGTTRRERLALEAVDEFLALDRKSERKRDLASVNEEIKARLRAIWGERTQL